MTLEPNDPHASPAPPAAREITWPSVAAAGRWLDRVDPGTHRRIKGLRLVVAYGIAAMLGTLADIAHWTPSGTALGSLAGGFALWASVSEGRGTRPESSRDLLVLSMAAAAGAASFAILVPVLRHFGLAGPELTLASGAFLVGYLRRFGITGAGVGSQIYIGQLLAYGARLGVADIPTIILAGLIAVMASIAPRLLSGPAERPAPAPAPLPVLSGFLPPELVMGLQGAVAAIVIVVLNAAFGLTESAWAITACTYVIAGSAADTIVRVERRVLGTVIGVPIGLAFLPLVAAAPLIAWPAAALAMVIYAMALPERYDVACGAFAFALIITMVAGGEHSALLLASRAWETLLGGAVGLAAALLLLPLRSVETS